MHHCSLKYSLGGWLGWMGIRACGGQDCNSVQASTIPAIFGEVLVRLSSMMVQRLDRITAYGLEYWQQSCRCASR